MFRDDETLAAAIEAARMLGATSARGAAEKTLRRKPSDEEWSKGGSRWEAAWAKANPKTTTISVEKFDYDWIVRRDLAIAGRFQDAASALRCAKELATSLGALGMVVELRGVIDPPEE